MGNIFGFLVGKRTFLISIIIPIVAFARQQLWVDENTYNWLMPLLGGGAAITLRLAISNALKQIASLVDKD